MTPTLDTSMGNLLKDALRVTWGPRLAGDVGRLLCLLVLLVALALA